MKITFNKDTCLIIDKSPINFKNVEFNVVKFDDDIVRVKLTRKGTEQFKNSVLNRTHKFGNDNYLINFLTKELKGEIEYKNIDNDTEWEYNAFAKQIKEQQENLEEK
tara:strand:+ start:239 stop:559 length:321 start_codon:yes stop_codon:yes gene_type:complete